MSDTALTITIGYTVLTILFVIIGLVVFRSTRVGFRVKTASRETVEKREGYWGIAVIVFLVAVLGGTMVQLPNSKSDQGDGAPQKLAVAGRQFAWTVKPARVSLDEAKCTRCGHCIDVCDHGALAGERASQDFEPRIDDELCNRCGACEPVCTYTAIVAERFQASVNQEKCTNCGTCVEACPFDSIRRI